MIIISKDIVWGMIHGAGEILATCDWCECDEVAQEFEDSCYDFKEAQNYLRGCGWSSRKVNGEWYDFCCKECENEFISSTLKL